MDVLFGKKTSLIHTIDGPDYYFVTLFMKTVNTLLGGEACRRIKSGHFGPRGK